MSFILQPWQLYVAIIAGWIHRQQQEAIDYLRTENRVLRETHGPKRILLNDDQRRRLAVKGKILGRKRLEEMGHNISDQSVGNILKKHGIEPAPERKRQTTWATFLKAHWDVLGSIDFTTIEVWTKGGLVTFYLLFVMEVATRRVHFGGCTTNPTETWMKQIARNLTDCEDGFLNGKRFLIMDRDTKFADGFCEILECQGVEAVKLPPRSPDLNPHIERFVRSIKDESLSRLILFGENMLRNAVRQFLTHYHTERNHQSLDNTIIQPGDEAGRHEGDVQCRERLGGMLRYYYCRDAA